MCVKQAGAGGNDRLPTPMYLQKEDMAALHELHITWSGRVWTERQQLSAEASGCKAHGRMGLGVGSRGEGADVGKSNKNSTG